MKTKSAILAVASAVVFTVAAAEPVCPPKGGVTKAEYLDLMEAAVASYSDDHIRQYIDRCAREGVTEHGFPLSGRHPLLAAAVWISRIIL